MNNLDIARMIFEFYDDYVCVSITCNKCKHLTRCTMTVKSILMVLEGSY